MDGSYAAAAMSLYDSTKKVLNKKASDEQQTYDAAMAVPRAVAAYYTFGLSSAAEGFARKQWGGTMKKLDKLNQKTMPIMYASRLWTSDKWKTEGNRIKKLLDQGVAIPEELQYRMNQKRGIRKSELINKNFADDFVGQTDQGWVNNKFNNSRNEADMRYEDLMPYATFYEKFGNDWLGKFNEGQRRAITQKAIDSGAVREHHGTVDVDWNKVGDVGQIANAIPQQASVMRPGRGQVARTSAGVYVDDRGRSYRAATRDSAMAQAYNNKIPRRTRG
jgi:hypothetical protein